MNGVAAAPPQRFKCAHGDCGATFTKQRKLEEHETVHTGERPCQCAVSGCGRRFTRQSHLSRHMLQHREVKQFRCKFATCTKSFFTLSKLKRHAGFAHADKNKYFKCNRPNCSLTFKKRRLFKLHLMDHQVPAVFKCTKEGCTAKLHSHIARKAHEKKHAGYCCPHADCQVMEPTWGKLKKHMTKHLAKFTCKVCKKEFKKVDSLRRHKWIHASHKPVLVCPKKNCQAYFSTTFNLQHHIRKVHLELLKYKCSFPDCPRMFAMRVRRKHGQTSNVELLNIFLNTQQKRQRAKKRAKVETNLSSLFNERKIPHFVDSEVNLRDLFGIKQQSPLVVKPEVAPVNG
uniref:P43 5S RNA-binding protein n=1 Tax=Cynoglossus semilaevis TaxID=244447 RepID=A0A3P8WGD5_CYNSE